MTDTANGQAPANLEGLIAAAGGAVPLLRGSALGPYVFPGIPAEFTNWRDEQRAWQDSCALLELSYHMGELHLRGPGAAGLLARLGVNKFKVFPVKRGKQLVVAAPDGYMIGDVILFHEEDEFYRLVGSPAAMDWVQYNAEKEGVEAVSDPSWSVFPHDRDVFRVQVQGPNALEMMRKATNNTLPEIGFFHVGEFSIDGHAVRALRHGMAGTPGYEIYGPWAEGDAVREALMRAGAEFGVRRIGAAAYSTTAQESGWMPMPLPAIYHGEELRPYREWLSSHHLESIGSLGGSLVSDDITDYYVDPIEVGYGGLIDFEHEFVGREALRERVANPRRKKVTLVWDEKDVLALMRDSMFGETPTRFLNTPMPMYATWQSDAVLKDGAAAGVSQWAAYSANAKAFISLALVDVEHAVPGTEVSLMWGEPNSRRPTVEAHEPREIKAKVAPSPLFEKVIKSGRQ